MRSTLDVQRRAALRDRLDALPLHRGRAPRARRARSAPRTCAPRRSRRPRGTRPRGAGRPRAGATGCRARRARRARGDASGLVLAGGDDHVDARGLERLHRGARGGARADDGHGHLAGARARAASRAAGSPRSRTPRARGWRATPSTRDGEQRVVGEGRVDPDRHGVGLRAPAVGAGAARPRRRSTASRRCAVATLPSSVIADLKITSGRPVRRVLAERLVEQPRRLGHVAVHARRPSTPSSRRIPGPRPGRLRASGRRRRRPRARCPPR